MTAIHGILRRSSGYIHSSLLSIAGIVLLGMLVTLLSGCGGSDYDEVAATPPIAQILEARFVDLQIEGIGFAGGAGTEGRTDASGRFSFAAGQPVEFFLGEVANRLVIGRASLAATGAAEFGLHDLDEVRADASDRTLGNLLQLLTVVDADADPTNGVRIEPAVHAAIAQLAAGGKRLDLAQPMQAFAADPLVASLLATLSRRLGDPQELLARFTTLFRQSRSTSIALTRDDRRVVVVNRGQDSVSVLRVRRQDGSDAGELLAEVPVGREPRSVAIGPDDRFAYVSNAIDGTLSVIDLEADTPSVAGGPIPVGFEPRGIAITPNGSYAFVAIHTSGEVAIVRLATREVVGRLRTGGNPYAVAITNDGDRKDLDERVYVTRLFGEVIDPARPDGFDDAKQGVIDSFTVGEAIGGGANIERLLLKPVASGFAADRRPFCLATRRALQDAGTAKFFNSGATGTGDGASQLAQPTFCPDPASSDATAEGPIARHPQKVYPNMLFGALVRGTRLYVPNVGAQPEPPVRFNVNVQGLVGVLDRLRRTEDGSLNLNAQVVREKQPAEGTPSLDRLFLNDLVAMDADRRGRDFLFVSRGGDYVLRASLDTDGRLSILDAANVAKRFQTGLLPTGVVISADGRRAYTNNELGTSVTAIDLVANTVLERNIESSPPPAPGTPAHRLALGKYAFFTALGLPDRLDSDGDDRFDVALRSIDPLAHRNKASDNGWSGCASCHDDGHSDNVTWIFETGPRQTIPLEGTFARRDPGDQRILNWSGVRGGNTDFNNNARGIQGGKGFASTVGGEDRSAGVFNHGPVRGISDSLDAMNEWVASVRAPRMPDLPEARATAGRAVFVQHCAACHGGVKWTKSRTAPLFAANPTFAEDPVGAGFFAGIKPIDIGLAVAGPQLVSVTRPGKGTLKLLDAVGTFSVSSPLEIRGAAAVAGQSTQGFAAFGALGFNSPSLLGVAYSSPYFHDGSALTLEQVAARHLLAPGGQSIAATLPAGQLGELLDYVRAIDDDTAPVESDTDRFLK